MNTPVIDLMLGIPGEDNSKWYEFMRPLLLDDESRTVFKMPAQYMFKNIPEAGKQEDFIAYTVAQMDKHGIERAMIAVSDDNAVTRSALQRFPQRFFASYAPDPNSGMDGVRNIVRMQRAYGIKAVTAFPCGLCPQVPIDDKKWYPIYAKCVELDLPFVCCVGVPGPRLPMAAQKVELIDEVCWFFPELKFVMRHGAEPWTELAVKLVECLSIGFGFSTVRFKGVVETLLVSSVTPIDGDNVDVRFSFCLKKIGGAEITKGVGAAFIGEVARQLEQDIPIWENKTQWERPVLCDGMDPSGCSGSGRGSSTVKPLRCCAP